MAQRVSPPAPRAEPAAADERVEWAAVTRNEAERALDDQLAALADVETVGVTARQGPEGAEVRTVQRLADGRTVELIQQRLSAAQEEVRSRRAAPSTAEAAAPTTAALPSTLVSVEWSNSRVTARGALPADSLRALLRRLRRAPPER